MRALLLSACVLLSTNVVGAPDTVRHAGTARLDLWLIDSGANPCLNRHARCDSHRFLIYERIITARNQGDAQSADRWLNILRWYDVADDPRR